MDIQGIRKDGQFLRLAERRYEDNFHKKGGLNVSESVAALIRKLAESHSQGRIAEILNERGLLRNGNELWKQFHVSRYFKNHNLKPVCKWKGTPNIDPSNEC